MTVTDGTENAPPVPSNRRPTTQALPDLSDLELLGLVRAGHDDAFGELFVRHASSVRNFATHCCSDVAEAEDMAAEAFFRAFQAMRRGSGPEDNVRAYLLTVVRRLAAEWRMRRRDVPVADDELGRQVDADVATPVSGADLQLIARAFTTLPWRWRAVLWRVEVEGERPAVVARHFGLSANATAALARRARQGLRAAYLQAHLAPTGGAHGCRTVVAKLGGFTAGQVTGAEADRIRRHLAACRSCRQLHAELLDVCAGLRRYAGALPVVAGLGLHGTVTKAALTKTAVTKTAVTRTLLTRTVGRFAWHAAATGARVKFVVAAVSVAAVGGIGVAGPLISYLSPSPEADRGTVVGPLLTELPQPQPMPGALFTPTARTGLHADLRGGPPLRPVAAPVAVRVTIAPTGPTPSGTGTSEPTPASAPSASAPPSTSQATPPATTGASTTDRPTPAGRRPNETAPGPDQNATSTTAPPESAQSGPTPAATGGSTTDGSTTGGSTLQPNSMSPALSPALTTPTSPDS